MAAKRKEPSIMEVLRAIRDKSSLKIMNMTFEEQQAYFAEGAKWFTDRSKTPVRAKRKTAARPASAHRKPTARKVVANGVRSARKAK